MEGVFLDEGSVNRGDLDMSGLESVVSSWHVYGHTEPRAVVERSRDAQLVLTNKVILDANAIQQAKRLKLICVAATGTNNVDLDAAGRHGISVCNVRGYATASVVQHVFGLCLSLAVRLGDYRHAVREGHWQSSLHFALLEFPIFELAGKKLGIIGYGELGQAVARVAEAMGMEVLVAARRGGPTPSGRVPFDRVLAEADVLSLHCPLTPETKGLIGEQELASMKPTALLINTARGGIVDEVALADALRNQRLGGAGVDVLTEEPPRHGNPLLEEGIPNLIVTPHIAWASRESRQRLVDELVNNVQAYLNGQPRNLC